MAQPAPETALRNESIYAAMSSLIIESGAHETACTHKINVSGVHLSHGMIFPPEIVIFVIITVIAIKKTTLLFFPIVTDVIEFLLKVIFMHLWVVVFCRAVHRA